MAWMWDGHKVYQYMFGHVWSGFLANDLAGNVSSVKKGKNAKKAVQSRELAGCNLTQLFKRLEMKLDCPCSRGLIKFMIPWIIIVLNVLIMSFSEEGELHWVQRVNPHLLLFMLFDPSFLCKVQSIHTPVEFEMRTSLVACLVQGSTWSQRLSLKLFLRSVAQHG